MDLTKLEINAVSAMQPELHNASCFSIVIYPKNQYAIIILMRPICAPFIHLYIERVVQELVSFFWWENKGRYREAEGA